MAKVIRKCWVYRKNNRWFRYLPRRSDAHINYDYDKTEGLYSDFEDPMPYEAPKLWAAWIQRDLQRVPKVSRDILKQLFGEKPTPGEINVFKNIPSTNKELWKIKTYIEIRPITFPNGEPTNKTELNNIELLYDGRCIINEKEAPNPEGINLLDPLKQFTPQYLTSRLCSRDLSNKDVYEDNVYNPSNISIVD